jgi:hypothetical protein
MVRRDPGPRRTKSVDAYLRGTRSLAVVAVLALVGAVLWDALDGRFWASHALLAGLVSSVILTVALVNEALERRSRQRWSAGSEPIWTGAPPAALIEGPLDDEQLVQRIAAITQLAEQLDPACEARP